MLGECQDCGCDIEDVNVEAFELFNRFLCPDCADERFEREAQATEMST